LSATRYCDQDNSVANLEAAYLGSDIHNGPCGLMAAQYRPVRRWYITGNQMLVRVAQAACGQLHGYLTGSRSPDFDLLNTPRLINAPYQGALGSQDRQPFRLMSLFSAPSKLAPV
jgi:hypothetical protein